MFFGWRNEPTRTFIRRSGKHLFLGSKRFRFIGVNTYDLVQGHYSKTQLETFFSNCVSDKIKVVRLFALNKTGPASNASGYFRYLSGNELLWREETFQDLDLVIYIAKKYDVFLSLVLADNWPENHNWGHKQEYCFWSNTINGTSLDRFNNGDGFFFNNGINVWFEEFLYKLANRRNTYTGVKYKNDPTIMRWELCNEGRYTTGTDSNTNTINSFRLAQLTTWYRRMSNYLRAQDPNHLIGTGSISQFFNFVTDDPVHNGSFYGQDYVEQHKLTNIDNFDFHMYPYEDYDADENPIPPLRAYGQSFGHEGVTAAGFKAQIREYVTKAHANLKPSILGEEGIDKRNTYADTFPAYPRSEHYSQLFTEFFDVNDGDGLFIWHYTHLFDDNNYNIKPDGQHTGSNNPGNANSDDTTLRTVIRAKSQLL